MISPAEIIDTFLANTVTLPQATIRWLFQHGVSPIAIAQDADGCGYELAAACVTFDGCYFDFSDEGKNAFVVVVRDEHGTVADLVAFDTRRIAPWLGRVCLLGETEIGEPLRVDPIAVHRTPLDWLRAGRCGVVILNASRARWLLSDMHIVAADLEHALALEKALTGPTPRIRIKSPILQVAA